MQKLCCACTRQHPLPVWSHKFVLSSTTHISTNSHPFLVGIVSSIHEWDPSVLDYSHPEGDEEPIWACDPQHIDFLDTNFDAHGVYTKRAINILSSLPYVLLTSHRQPTHSLRPTNTKSSQHLLTLINIDPTSVV